MSMKTGKIIINAAIALLSVTLLFLSCEKSSLGGRDGLKGYWMSDREYSDCKRVYYFDGEGGGTVYYYLNTSSTYWNRDCDCHRYNTDYVGTFNGTKYYKQRDAGMSALIYTIMGSSIVISTNGSDDIEYLNYSDGNLSGYTKVSKR